ncbi:MAG: hypothetical protein LBI70_01585 [Rickettsiales bacterium]|jgi:hypothetical protein|nr:hypothetical protein [Rickettsiales bacterium]
MEEDIFEIVKGKLVTTDSITIEEKSYLKEKGFLEGCSFQDSYIFSEGREFLEESVKNLQRELPASIEDLPITFLEYRDKAEDIVNAPAGIVVLYNAFHTTAFIKNKINSNTEIFVLDSLSSSPNEMIDSAYGKDKNCIIRYPATAESIKREEEWAKTFEKTKKEHEETLKSLGEAKKRYKEAGILEKVKRAEELRYGRKAPEELNLTPREKAALEELKDLESKEQTLSRELSRLKTDGIYISQGERKYRYHTGIQKASSGCKFFALEFVEKICEKIKDKKKGDKSLSTLQALRAVTDGFEKQGSENFMMPNFLIELGESETALNLAIEWQKNNNKTDFVSTAMILAFKEEREKRLEGRLNELEKELEEFRNSLKTEKGKTEEEKEKEVSKKQEENKKKLKQKRGSLIREISTSNNLRRKHFKKLYKRLKEEEKDVQKSNGLTESLEKEPIQQENSISSSSLLSNIGNANQKLEGLLEKETSKQSAP